MRLRSFIIGYALIPALLLFALPGHSPRQQNRYSHVLDLTEAAVTNTGIGVQSRTRIISPAALLPGTWDAAQIPAERLIGPLVVMDLNAPSLQISVEEIANWEAQHGTVPLGAIIAVRRIGTLHSSTSDAFPLSADAAQFLMDARYSRGFMVETPARLSVDPRLSRQIALHGNYVVEGSTRLAALPETGSLLIVAPAENRKAVKSPVRVLAMVGQKQS
jgi:kynurenine formamidase